MVSNKGLVVVRVMLTNEMAATVTLTLMVMVTKGMAAMTAVILTEGSVVCNDVL